MATEGQQEHPLSIYLWIWVLLFVLSLFSYMVDYIGFEGYLRWSLILLFMFAKAGFIIQKPPLPGSSLVRGTLTKHRLSERL